MSVDKKKYPIDEFLEEVVSRREERGFLAELRRGLTPATEEQAWPHIARFAGSGFVNDTVRRIWETIGGLAAMLVADGLMQAEGFASVGNVMRRIKEGEKSLGESGIKSYETKFRRVLNSPDAIDLCDLVSEVGRNAARKGIAVNCRRLFWDLSNWDDADEREKIRVMWARDFYGVFDKKEDESANGREGFDE